MQTMLTIIEYFFTTGRTKLSYMMEVLIQDILDLMNWDPLVVRRLQRSFDTFFDSITKSENVNSSTRWLLYKEHFDNGDERKFANFGDQLYASIALYGNCFGYILMRSQKQTFAISLVQLLLSSYHLQDLCQLMTLFLPLWEKFWISVAQTSKHFMKIKHVIWILWKLTFLQKLSWKVFWFTKRDKTNKDTIEHTSDQFILILVCSVYLFFFFL